MDSEDRSAEQRRRQGDRGRAGVQGLCKRAVRGGCARSQYARASFSGTGAGPHTAAAACAWEAPLAGASACVDCRLTWRGSRGAACARARCERRRTSLVHSVGEVVQGPSKPLVKAFLPRPWAVPLPGKATGAVGAAGGGRVVGAVTGSGLGAGRARVRWARGSACGGLYILGGRGLGGTRDGNRVRWSPLCAP
jgi:hypothetical protein